MLHHQKVELGRVARAFDLAGITNTAGAPFLRVFCEGMGRRQREWRTQRSLKMGDPPSSFVRDDAILVQKSQKSFKIVFHHSTGCTSQKWQPL